jgi:hypothetical protein
MLFLLKCVIPDCATRRVWGSPSPRTGHKAAGASSQQLHRFSNSDMHGTTFRVSPPPHIYICEVLFEALMAVSRKMAVVWVVAPCRLVWVYRRFRGLYCLQRQSDDRPTDGGRTDLWNTGKLIPVYTALQPRRQTFMYVKFDVTE